MLAVFSGTHFLILLPVLSILIVSFLCRRYYAAFEEAAAAIDYVDYVSGLVAEHFNAMAALLPVKFNGGAAANDAV